MVGVGSALINSFETIENEEAPAGFGSRIGYSSLAFGVVQKMNLYIHRIKSSPITLLDC